MSGLRCWPGALAIVVRAKLPENVGLLVRCIELVPLDAGAGPMWMTECARPAPSVWIHSGRPSPGLEHRALCPDAWLRPITPPPGTDCTTHDADKPQSVEAA